MPHRSRVAFRLLLLLASVGGIAACANVVSIDADDSVSFSNFEASMPPGADSATRLRLRGSKVDGAFAQSLDSDERIRTGDANIEGPTSVEGDLELAYYSLAIGWDSSSPGLTADDLRQRFYLGLARTDFDLVLADAAERFRGRDHTTELYLQYGLRHAVSDSFALGLDWAVSLGREFSGIREIDLALDFRLLRQVHLAGGYRWLDYVYAEEESESDIEVDFRGPFIGLTFAL